MIDFNNKGFFKLKQNDEYAERVSALLLEGEQVIDSYKAMRDGGVHQQAHHRRQRSRHHRQQEGFYLAAL